MRIALEAIHHVQANRVGLGKDSAGRASPSKPYFMFMPLR